MGRITASRTHLKPDPKYGSELAGKFINCMMWSGKKATAQRIFYDALDEIKSRMGEKEPIEVFLQAVENVKPHIEVRSKRVGGASYQVPMQVNRQRQQSLAIRWLLQSTKARPGKSMADKLAAELLDAAQGVGATIKKKEDTHRMAEANRAFSHYQW